jgi:ribonuclease J
MRQLYAWLKPAIAIPVHGEAMHLAAHARFARELGVPTVLEIENGAMIRLAPAPAEQVDEITAGRIYKDGSIVGDIDMVGVPERRRLAFSGHVGVALVMSERGEVEQDPEIVLIGLPKADRNGRPLDETVLTAILGTLDSIPRPRRRDPEVVREAVRRSVRAVVAEAWGKKPVCTVFVAVV